MYLIQEPIVKLMCTFQLVTEKLKSIYKLLEELVSPEMNFQRYKQELQMVHQMPCLPRLSK